MATVNGDAGFTQLKKLNVTDELLVAGSAVNFPREVEFTATHDDDDYRMLTIDTAGYSSVAIEEVVYNMTGNDASDAVALINIAVNATNAVDSRVTAIFVNATEPGNLGAMAGLTTNVGIDPVVQFVAGGANQTVALVNAVDELTDLTTPGSLVPIFVADDDTVTIGADAKFDAIDMILDTVADADVGFVVEYSDGVGTFTSFVFTDTSNGLTQSGSVGWVIDNIPLWVVGDGSGNYLIRLTRTTNSPSAGTTVADTVIVRDTSSFRWDKTGNLSICDLFLHCTAVGTGTTPPSSLAAHQVWKNEDGQLFVTDVPT